MKSTVSSVRILLALGWGLVCVLTVAAPLLLARGEPGALPLYWGFSFFCHQLPGRSFTLAGLPLAACHRCVGIYLGLFAGIVAPVPGFSGSPRARRRWLLAALLPALIDTALARAGLPILSTYGAEPSLEDVFLRLVADERREEGGGA